MRRSITAPHRALLVAGAPRLLARGGSTAVRGGVTTELCVLGLGVLAPLFAFFVLPTLTDAASSANVAAVALYTVLACAAAVMLGTLLLVEDGFSVSLSCLALSLLISVAGGAWSVLHGGTGLTATDAVVRVLWALALLLVVAALAHPSLRRTEHDRAVADGPAGSRQVGVLAVGLLLPALSMVVQLGLGQTRFLGVEAALALVVSCLALSRLAGLMSQLSDQTRQLQAVACSDELTGLPNRRGWQALLVSASAAAARADGRLGIAVIELDEFAAFNAAQGLATGDRFLRRLAADWSHALRDGEVLARFGGVQFAVLLPGLDLAATHRRVEELRQLVPTPRTASAGVSVRDPERDGDQALLEADAALYLARCQGGNRTAVVGTSSDVLPGPLRDLQTAVQPIVRLDDTATVAVECLSRFPHTSAVESVFADAHEKGFGDLLEVAAISRVLALPDRPVGIEVWVNVSERAARSTRFWAGLPVDLTGVVVELVEQRDGLSDAEVARVFDRFRARGARVALDDVGSSCTDFARIATLRPDIAKIDRSLVAACDTNPSQAEVLRMLVGYAISHGAEVVVEGVETPGELAVARAVGATYAQGYLLGRPGAPWPAPAAQRPPATRSVVPVT